MNQRNKMLCALLITCCGMDMLFADMATPSKAVEKSCSKASAEKCTREDCDECNSNTLKLKLLCANRIKVKCIDAETIKTIDLTVTGNFCTENIITKSVCTDRLGVNQTACIPTLTSTDIQSTTLCVTGTARFNEVCGRYRAFASFATDTNYTLGDLINFNVINDDPNGNVSLAPFKYTAPATGYYIISTQVDQLDLVLAPGSSPILGVPTGNLEILVNGVTLRKATTAFLTFSNQQQNTNAALIRLNQGDEVQLTYGINQLTDTGFSPVAGTVTLEGGVNFTLFSIHYLSSDCAQPTCEPRICTPCSTTCTPPVPCVPCTPRK
jgi:hypothetical protein